MSENQSKNFILKYGALCLSVVALCMSGYTFWKTQFYNPDPVFTTGEFLSVGHASQGNGQVVLPVVAMNPGSKAQVVERLVLEITPPSGKAYRFMPYFYQKINAVGGFENESNAEPILVQSNGMTLKYVWFISSQKEPFRFAEPGLYKAHLLSWTRGSTQPSVSHTFTFNLSGSQVQEVEPNDDTMSRIVLGKFEDWSVGPVSR